MSITKGSKPVKVGDLPDEVVKLLRDHSTRYNIINFTFYPVLNNQSSASIKLFYCENEQWQSVTRFPSHITDKNALALYHRGGGGGSGQTGEVNSTKPGMQDLLVIPPLDITNVPGETYINRDPTVSIGTPNKGTLTLGQDRASFINNVVDTEMDEGETVADITRRITGTANPDALFNHTRVFTRTKPPQSGDPVRIAKDTQLVVSGTVSNNTQVTLVWDGPTRDSQNIAVQKGADNEDIDWRTQIPFKPGDYTFTATAGQARSTRQVTIIDPNAHWVKFKLLDEDSKPVKQALDYVVRFDDGTKIRSQFKNGLDYLTGVPLLPFTIEIIPGKTLNKKLAVLREKLRTELATSIAQVKADTARHEKDWAKIGNVEAGFIYLGSGLTGAGEWIVDTVKGVTELATGIVNANIATYAWTGKYLGHRAEAFASYASGDTEGLKQSTQNIDAMHQELGEDVSEISDHAETLALLAWDDDTRNMLVDFPGDYFAELSGVEQTRAVTRYGIDFLLIFVAGAGAGLLAIKNSGRISKLLKEMLELIKQLRFQQTVKKPKVDDTYPFGPVKKPSSAGSSLAKEKGLSDPPEGYHWADVNGKPTLRKNPGTLGPQKKYNAEKDEFVDVPKKKSQDNTDTGKKGLIGEQKADEYMSNKGYAKIGGRGNKPQGIDGVYENSKPPPKFVVAEAKYDTSGYGKTVDGEKQMSKKWVNRRLREAVGKEKAKDIKFEGYKRVELRYDPVTDTVKQRDIPW